MFHFLKLKRLFFIDDVNEIKNGLIKTFFNYLKKDNEKEDDEDEEEENIKNKKKKK